MLRRLPAMRAAAQCLYETLGVPRDASWGAIKGAFRERAKQTHPDMSGGGAAQEFREMVEAYRVLGDPKLRAEYDREVAIRAGGPSPGGHGPWGCSENTSVEFQANSHGYRVRDQTRGYRDASCGYGAAPQESSLVASAWAEAAVMAIGAGLVGGYAFFSGPRPAWLAVGLDPYPLPAWLAALRRLSEGAAASVAAGGATLAPAWG